MATCVSALYCFFGPRILHLHLIFECRSVIESEQLSKNKPVFFFFSFFLIDSCQQSDIAQGRNGTGIKNESLM